ncbi:MAG: hypothetical protein H0W30_13115 [Gemmatimonadaceae bacterium]|nr:hypothetical protein [Gemmatimonadaceae bacterium]
MRAVFMRVAALLAITFTLSSCVSRSTPPGAAVDPAVQTTGSALSVSTEEERYYNRALRLRDRILNRATWMESEAVPCDPGALRIFSTDSASAARDSVGYDVNTLERLVIVRGIDNSLDAPRTHDLLRAVLAWEADAARPSWDVKQDGQSRKAIAAGLSGKFMNPETRKCESMAPFDTVYAVLPVLTGFSMRQYPNVNFVLAYGEEGLNRMRDAFFAGTTGSPSSVLNYVRVRAAVVWRDFAVIAVNRPIDSRGSVAVAQSSGGAAYIFRYTKGEWRLLTITRTWG